MRYNCESILQKLLYREIITECKYTEWLLQNKMKILQVYVLFEYADIYYICSICYVIHIEKNQSWFYYEEL